MAKKRVTAGNKAGEDDEDMYNLPLIPQQQEGKPPSAQLPATKKKRSEKAPESAQSDADEVDSVLGDADNGSEDNSSAGDSNSGRAQSSGAVARSDVHDKRRVLSMWSHSAFFTASDKICQIRRAHRRRNASSAGNGATVQQQCAALAAGRAYRRQHHPEQKHGSFAAVDARFEGTRDKITAAGPAACALRSCGVFSLPNVLERPPECGHRRRDAHPLPSFTSNWETGSR